MRCQEFFELKEECYIKLLKVEGGEAFEKYTRPKREAKKVISKAQGKASDGLYQKPGTR